MKIFSSTKNTNLSKWKFSVWQICPSDNFTQKCLFYNNLSTLKIPILDQLHCPSGNFQFDKLVQVTTSLKNAYFTTICPLIIPILDQLQCKFARKFQNFQKFVFFSLTNLSRWYFSARQKTNICQSGNFQFDTFVRAIILLKNTYFTTICPLKIPVL